MYKYHLDALPASFVNYFCKVADVHSYLTHQSVYTFPMQEQTKGQYNKNQMAQLVE